MDTKRLSAAVVGMVLLCLTAGIGGSALGQVKPAPAPMISSGPGRFVIVNPSPDSVRYIMLLDTQTGISWQICQEDMAARANWCPMAVAVKKQQP
jgi:hypothetical protein